MTIDAGIRHVKPQIRVFALVNGVDANGPPGPAFTRNTMVTITYVISNAGNAPLTEIVLTDTVFGRITTCPQTMLVEGEQMTCTMMRAVSIGQNLHSVDVAATTPADLNAIAVGDDVLYYFGN